MLAGTRRSIEVAQSLNCTRMIVTTGNVLADESYEITRRRAVRKLRQMANLAAAAGITLCLEPLNPLVDHRGYWLTTMAQRDEAPVHEVELHAFFLSKYEITRAQWKRLRPRYRPKSSESTIAKGVENRFRVPGSSVVQVAASPSPVP